MDWQLVQVTTNVCLSSNNAGRFDGKTNSILFTFCRMWWTDNSLNSLANLSVRPFRLRYETSTTRGALSIINLDRRSSASSVEGRARERLGEVSSVGREGISEVIDRQSAKIIVRLEFLIKTRSVGSGVANIQKSKAANEISRSWFGNRDCVLRK
jgi:hypothetical protein